MINHTNRNTNLKKSSKDEIKELFNKLEAQHSAQTHNKDSISPVLPLPSWSETLLNSILSSIVSLEIKAVQNFDVNTLGNSKASGFVVDPELGYILTNEHVVTQAPARITGIFSNSKEIDLVRVYVDVIHDFAFLKYNPQEMKDLDIRGIPLCPENLKKRNGN